MKLCEKSYGRRIIFLAMLATFGCFASIDTNMPWIKGMTDKAPLEYKVGETMVFSLAVQNAEYLPQGLQIVWRRTGDDGKSEEGKAPLSSAKPLTVRTSLCRPGFVRIFAEVCDRNGNPWMLEAQGGIRKGIFFDGGAAAEPRRLCQSKPEPKDFDAFWRKRVAELAAVPMKAETEEIVSPTKGVKLYKLTVTCAGARPATGYLSVPDKIGKYPAWIGFHGYGASWAKGATEPPRKLTADAVCLSLSAHGFELGRDDAYYKSFRQSVCRNGYGHAFDPAENARPETCYFGGMSWRVMRGIEYLKTCPEWNGRDLTVAGGSQGALQAIWGAALVPGVTKVQIEIPWCCDIGGTEDGRNHGDWFIRWMPGLDYYDPVNMSRRIPLSCNVRIARAGLGDYIAPPCGVAMFYNNLRCPKSIVWVQGSQHCNEPPVRDAFEWSDEPPNASPVSQAADFTIVSNCLPTACIVVNMDAPPGIRYAAEELARWTKELTGATLPVVSVPVKGLKPITFRQGAAEVTGDGFMLTALADRAEIAAGYAEQGILFGIYYILNRYGGIYWCHPESGADMPVGKRDFSLPGGVLVKNPMPFRQGVPSGDGPLATATVREMCARWNVRNGFPLCQKLIGADPAKIEPGNLYPNGLIRELGSDGTVRGGGHCLGRLLLETEVDAGELAREVEWTREHARARHAGFPRGEHRGSRHRFL